MDWNEMAAPWLRVEAETDIAHAPVLQGLLERAGLREGDQVLDIGPGGGISLIHSAQAVGPRGHVTGVEIAPPFAERARQRVPAHVTVIEADAQDHPFEPASFDAAISLFGVMFFRDNGAAFRNIHRSVKPGATLVFACWGAPQDNPWFSMASRISADVFGPGDAFDPTGPGPMRFGDAASLHTILMESGWTPEIEAVDLHLTPKGTPADVARLHMTIGSAAMRIKQAKGARTLTEAQKVALAGALTDGFAEMAKDGAIRVPAKIHFVRATA